MWHFDQQDNGFSYLPTLTGSSPKGQGFVVIFVNEQDANPCLFQVVIIDNEGEEVEHENFTDAKAPCDWIRERGMFPPKGIDFAKLLGYVADEEGA